MDLHLAHSKEQVLVAEIGLEDLQLAQWQEAEPQVEHQLAQGCPTKSGNFMLYIIPKEDW